MKILVLGGGGREHALVWAVAQNPKCDAVFAAPGNAGIAGLATCLDLDPCDGDMVVAACRAHEIDLVIVGPEAPLVAGVADTLREAGVTTFGPSQAAAELEASKAFTKEVCAAAGAPTAAARVFTEAGPALAYLEEVGAPIVVKADGLAAGKGVVVAEDAETAAEAIRAMFDGLHGAAGARVVLEEMMVGEEASFFVLCDGETALPIGTAQDHKRAFEGDAGPNTGGMGAYSPAPVLSEAVVERTMAEIVRPTLAEMTRRGAPYQGVLYVGLMIADGAPRLVEYNVRFGDPEAQVLLPRLGAQALDLIQATAEGRLSEMRVNWADDHAMTVVLAAEGYPGSYAKGETIGGLDAAAALEGVEVFHAGTELKDGAVASNGGRVLAVTGRGGTLEEARDRAYAGVDAVDWPGGFCRRDIGWRALKGN